MEIFRKLALIALLIATASCKKADENPKGNIKVNQKIVIIVPKSPAVVPLLRMAETNAMGEHNPIEIKYYTDMERLLAMAIDGNYTYLALPVHSAAALYNKGFAVKSLNIWLWGGMYLSTTDKTVTSWKDLKGKKLYVPSKGSVPDMLTNYFLNKNGLYAGTDVEIVYSNHIEISQFISIGKAVYMIDVEPFATNNRKTIPEYKVVTDFGEYWKESVGDEYRMPNFGIVVSAAALKDRKVNIELFNNELEKAVEWVVANPDEAGTLAEKYIGANAKLVAASIPAFKFKFSDASQAKDDINKYCEVISEFKPEIIGGKIPADEFYYGVDTNEKGKK